MRDRASSPATAQLLFPPPRRVRVGAQSWLPPHSVTLQHAPELGALAALEWLEQALHDRGHVLECLASGSESAQIRLELRSDLAAREIGGSAEGYVLRVTARGAHIAAQGAVGIQHGLATLVQWIALASAPPGKLALAEVAIEDHPDFAVRGVMLDISRDKVPTQATLRMLIDRLARWKVNQLQLYMEHTFAYAGHEVVWKEASPLSATDVRELDDFAAARHVELVPNQNSFGHMHRWLVHEPYRALAECPDGFDHPWNWASEPYGLCPTDPECLVLLEGLYDQLLPNFRSRSFNVGLDETIDLGRGRSKQACAERGAGRVYLEFLRAVHGRVQQRGRRMQFWSDIIREHAELIPELPKDAVALEWGYEAEHPFAEHLERLSRAGLEFYVCPGTSSWNSITGRTHNAVLNLAAAARDGKAAGATGLLVTDWGDNGHLQPLSVSYLGLLLGAGFSWNVAAAEHPLELDVARLLDAWAFVDAAAVMGRVAHDLGNTYREAGSLRANSSALFWILIKPERQFEPAGVTRETLERALDHAGRASAPLTRARPATAEGALAASELGWASDLLQFACRLGLARCSLENPAALGPLPPAAAAPLAGELDGLLERHRALWGERNRPGGLDDSARRLERIRDALRR